MDEVARLPTADRAALFGEIGAGRGVADTTIEKNFWVCWALRRLFGLPKGAAATLVFKGGTSLSKAFGAIRRFSEDKRIAKDLTANANSDLIEHAYRMGSLCGEKGYTFLKQTMRKRNLSVAQIAWKVKINWRIVGQTVVRKGTAR